LIDLCHLRANGAAELSYARGASNRGTSRPIHASASKKGCRLNVGMLATNIESSAEDAFSRGFWTGTRLGGMRLCEMRRRRSNDR
jgi:hypothetical protein